MCPQRPGRQGAVEPVDHRGDAEPLPLCVLSWRYTSEGWGLPLATNHLGHFRLATGLHDALAAAGDARAPHHRGGDGRGDP